MFRLPSPRRGLVPWCSEHRDGDRGTSLVCPPRCHQASPCPRWIFGLRVGIFCARVVCARLRPRFSCSTGAVKSPRNEQPELLRVSFASPSTLCIKVLGRQRGFGETPGTPCPLARWDGGLGCTPVAWIGWEEDFLNGKCLKSRRVLRLPARCPALFVPSGSFMLD